MYVSEAPVVFDSTARKEAHTAILVTYSHDRATRFKYSGRSVATEAQ